MLIDPVSIYFNIPATDHLGKNAVVGKVRFLEEKVELSWRLKGNVFRGGKGDMTTVDLPYSEIETAEVIKGWFRVKALVLRVGDPQKVKDMPGIEMGKMTLDIDSRSKQEAKKLQDIIDYKRSMFLVDSHEERMNSLRGE